jgi:hypothetical protein
MKKLATLGVAAVLVAVATIALNAETAEAHCIEVGPAGIECNLTGEPGPGWTGGPLKSADHPGQGLIPGGPGGAFKMSPAHGGGLNTACETIRLNGNGVVDIHGPGPSCPHGS